MRFTVDEYISVIHPGMISHIPLGLKLTTINKKGKQYMLAVMLGDSVAL